MRNGIFATLPMLMAAASAGAGSTPATEPEKRKKKKDDDPRPNGVKKSERAVNSIIRSCERLEVKGKSLTKAQQTACLKLVDESVAHLKQVLDGKASAKAGFTIPE